jgi:Flp pilus assembly protein TadB
MRQKSKLRSAVFSLAVCAGVFCAWCCVLLMSGEYYSARRKLDVSKQELQTWEACRNTKPSYFKSNAEAVSTCLKNFNEARDNRWLSLPKEQLIGLFVLAAVVSAVGGGLATWAVVWLVFLSVYRFVRLLAFCFLRHPGRQVNS